MKIKPNSELETETQPNPRSIRPIVVGSIVGVLLGGLLFIGLHVVIAPAIIMTFMFGGAEKSAEFIFYEPFWMGLLLGLGGGILNFAYKHEVAKLKLLGYGLVLASFTMLFYFKSLFLNSN